MVNRALLDMPDEPPPTESPPRTRGECADIPRPCPRYRCRMHLWTEAARAMPSTGAPDRRRSLTVLPSAEDSCALDVAEDGEHALEAIGALMGISRERVRQIEADALASVRLSVLRRFARAAP